jgi:hypothetical protein
MRVSTGFDADHMNVWIYRDAHLTQLSAQVQDPRWDRNPSPPWNISFTPVWQKSKSRWNHSPLAIVRVD